MSGAFREYGANQVIEAQHSLARAVALAPHIITRPVNAGNIDDSECLPPLVYTLISWAREPFNGDPTAFVQRVLDHLPPTAAQVIAPSVQAREHILSTAAVWAALDAICVDNPALARQHLSNAIKRLPKLRNQPDLAIALMIDYLKAFPSELQLTYAQRFFDALPSMNALRNKALARLHMARAFHEHTSGAVKESANAAKKGLQLDRSWLRNRGVLSILWQGWRA